MRIASKFKEYLADISIKIFQVVFAMLVIGMFLKEQFNIAVFVYGVLFSLVSLTTAVYLYYNATGEEE
ncbi:hypothetical protein ACFL31_01075 [Candidatus Margulisiibacteriota bacterium]